MIRAPHPAAPEKAAPRGQRTQAQIFGDGEVLAERELLMDDGDAGGERLLGAAKRDGAAEDQDSPGIDGVDAGERLSKRALARAVLAAERMARPRRHVERDVFERQRPGKTLGDT